METIIKNDLTWEHLMHSTYQTDCSDCHSENRMIKAKVTCVCKPKCIGCDTTENVEKCDGTLCRTCWSNENEE